MSLLDSFSIAAVVPAAGVGKRMLSDCPKQYMNINGATIIEHTVNRLLSCRYISQVVIALGTEDEYFPELPIAQHPKVLTVDGGKERVDSVLAGLNYLSKCGEIPEWVLVHDAARPCITVEDIEQLLNCCVAQNQGGLLGTPVRDTMKRTNAKGNVLETVEREHLWHALTPQMYKLAELKSAIESGLKLNLPLTDESSAIEAAGLYSIMIEGKSDNIKITRPDDLTFAQFILNNQQGLL